MSTGGRQAPGPSRRSPPRSARWTMSGLRLGARSQRTFARHCDRSMRVTIRCAVKARVDRENDAVQKTSCRISEAIGAKRTCRELWEVVDLTKLTNPDAKRQAASAGHLNPGPANL